VRWRSIHHNRLRQHAAEEDSAPRTAQTTATSKRGRHAMPSPHHPMSHAELCADTEIALERYLALSCIVRPPTVVERIVVCDPTNDPRPSPTWLQKRVRQAKLGWLKALLVSARICRLSRSPSANDLPAERFTSSIPGLRRLFLLKLPKVPAAGAHMRSDRTIDRCFGDLAWHSRSGSDTSLPPVRTNCLPSIVG